MNNTGPKILPCGMPLKTPNHLESSPLMLTIKCLLCFSPIN